MARPVPARGQKQSRRDERRARSHLGDREQNGTRARSMGCLPPCEPDRPPARTTASTRSLARNVQAPDARLWRISGRDPPERAGPASVIPRVRCRARAGDRNGGQALARHWPSSRSRRRHSDRGLEANRHGESITAREAPYPRALQGLTQARVMRSSPPRSGTAATRPSSEHGQSRSRDPSSRWPRSLVGARRILALDDQADSSGRVQQVRIAELGTGLYSRC
jgi:hypothetical protein